MSIVNTFTTIEYLQPSIFETDIAMATSSESNQTTKPKVTGPE